MAKWIGIAAGLLIVGIIGLFWGISSMVNLSSSVDPNNADIDRSFVFTTPGNTTVIAPGDDLAIWAHGSANCTVIGPDGGVPVGGTATANINRAQYMGTFDTDQGADYIVDCVGVEGTPVVLSKTGPGSIGLAVVGLLAGIFGIIGAFAAGIFGLVRSRRSKRAYAPPPPQDWQPQDA